MRFVPAKTAQQHESDGYKPVLQLASALGTLLFSFFVVAPKIYLISIYGWTRVWQENLWILHMPKKEPWTVSNGDFIPPGDFGFGLIVMACWLPLCFAMLYLVEFLFPVKPNDNNKSLSD